MIVTAPSVVSVTTMRQPLITSMGSQGSGAVGYITSPTFSNTTAPPLFVAPPTVKPRFTVLPVVEKSLQPLSSTRMGTAEAQKPTRAPPTPPKLVKQKRVSQKSPAVYQRQRKAISVLEIRKGDDDEGSVTILVEGGRESANSSFGSDGYEATPANPATPLASRRWTRRNKLTGLSLSFKVRGDDNDSDYDDDDDDDDDDNDNNEAGNDANDASRRNLDGSNGAIDFFDDDDYRDSMRQQGGDPSEGWAYISGRRRGPASPRGNELTTGGKRRLTTIEDEVAKPGKRAMYSLFSEPLDIVVPADRDPSEAI